MATAVVKMGGASKSRSGFCREARDQATLNKRRMQERFIGHKDYCKLECSYRLPTQDQ